jgi:hypothetical protein
LPEDWSKFENINTTGSQNLQLICIGEFWAKFFRKKCDRKMRPSGKISPNLVTLPTMKKIEFSKNETIKYI